MAKSPDAAPMPQENPGPDRPTVDVQEPAITEQSLRERGEPIRHLLTSEEHNRLDKLFDGNDPDKFKKMDQVLSSAERRIAQEQNAPVKSETEDVLDASEAKPEAGEGTEIHAEDTVVEKKEEIKIIDIPPEDIKKVEEKSEPKTPEEQARQRIDSAYPEEKEREVIQKRVKQKLKDPNFIKACERNVVNKFLASPDLSERERRSLVDYGDFAVKGFLQKIDIRDVAGLVAGGMNVEDIRNIKMHFFTGKVKMPDGKEHSSEEFDKLIEDNLKNKIKEIAEREAMQEWMEMKKSWIELESIKIKAERAEVQEKERRERKAEQTKGARDEAMERTLGRHEQEARERTQKANEKKQEAEKLPVEEKMELLNDLRNNWRKAEKIFVALRDNRKIKINAKETLYPKNVKDAIRLDEMSSELTGIIIEKAQKLTGRDLRAEARLAVSSLSEENAGEYKKEDFYKWLTLEVEKIFEEKKVEIEAETGKKVKFTKKKSS